MAKEDLIEVEGKIIDVLTGGKYKVQWNVKDGEKEPGKVQDKNQKHIVIAYLSGKMKQNKIRIVLGDSVTVALSPYDLSKGIIKFRAR